MKKTTLLDIAAKINQVAKADGVKARVNFKPGPIRVIPISMELWDIELTYNNYHYVERFNNDMPIGYSDVEKIAKYLLVGLFSDYFADKLG